MNISAKSTFTITVTAALAGVGGIFATGWRMANAARDIKEEIAALRRDVNTIRIEVQTSAAERWTIGDMERWSFQLERWNRERGLVVPDARAARNTSPDKPSS